MSEDSDVDVEVEHPHVHHQRTGHRWVDLVLPVAALFVSLISILIALHHGRVMTGLVEQNERLVEANSLPWLQLAGSNPLTNGLQSVTLDVSNQGVGPGEIRSVQILVDGRPVTNPRALMDACCRGVGYGRVGTSTLLGRMMRPGERISFVSMPALPSSQEAVKKLNEARSERIEVRLCYCSVFGECWNVTSRNNSRPTPVEQCTMPQPQYAH